MVTEVKGAKTGAVAGAGGVKARGGMEEAVEAGGEGEGVEVVGCVGGGEEGWRWKVGEDQEDEFWKS